MFNEFALKIDILIELLVSPTNLYAKQNERNFVTKKKKVFSRGKFYNGHKSVTVASPVLGQWPFY